MPSVKRFVAPSRRFDAITFAPEEQGHALAGILPFQSLRSRKASLVLGEPGAGKSTALRDLRDSIAPLGDGFTAHHLDLKEYSEADLRDAIAALPDVDLSHYSKHVLLLDSVDEARFQIHTLVPFLARRLGPLIAAGWRVVATCRTAETVQAIDEFFESLEEGAVHVLLPLRESDVVAIAQGHGLDAGAFMAVVEQQSLHSLAAIPFTLELLCQAFAVDGAIGATRADIYERAISLLLAQGETTQDGYAPVTRLPAAPVRVQLTAERLAAFVALTDSAGLGVARLGEPMSGVATEFLAGQETLKGVEVEIGQDDLQSILQTALFADSGPGQRQFAHRSLRDYLAARCLARWALKPTQLESFLTSSNGLASIPPKMLDIATWLVILNPPTSDWLVRADAFNLARNRLGVYRPDLAPELVTWLIAHAADCNRVLSWHDSLRGLAHSKLAEQLRPALAADNEQRLMALSILEDSYVAGLGEHLLEIVLDGELSVRERMNAIGIMRAQGLDEQLAKLVPLREDFFASDEVAQLRGAVLASLWPAHIDTAQMLELLVNPPENYYGSYESFLHLAETSLSTQDAAVVLRWAAQRLPSIVDDDDLQPVRGPHGRSIRKLVESACVSWVGSSPKQDESFEHLAAIISAQLDTHPSKLPVARDQMRFEDWRELLLRIVQLRADDPHAHYGLLSARDSAGASPFQDADLNWVVEQSVHAPPAESAIWAQVTNRLLNIGDPDHLEIVWDYRHTPLWDVVGPRYESIELSSAEAQRQRMYLQQLQGIRPEPSDARSISEPEYLETVSRIIERVATEPGFFWHLVRWLDVDLAAGQYADSYTPDLLGLKSIGLLEPENRGTMLEFALAYVEQASDDVFPQRLKPSTRYFQLTSAYQALHTLEKHSPERLDNHDINWGALVRSILEYPLHFNHNDENTQIRRKLLSRVRDSDPGRLEMEVRKLFRRSLTSSMRDYSIEDLAAVPTKKMVGHMKWALRSGHSPDSPAILELLFTADPDAATQWCVNRIPESDSAAELASLLLALLNHAPEVGFPELYRFAESRQDLAKVVLLELAQNERTESLRLASVNEATLLQLFEWLADNFPRNEESFPTGMHAISSREDLADWRDRLLRRVIQSGSKSALDALTALTQRRSDLELEWSLSALRESYRLNGWLPLAIDELRALQDQEGARLVRSNDDLMRVVLEELEAIQGWLTYETPQAFSLWNQAPPDYQSPKDENTISDWYCHALRLRLRDRGLIINREVEVRRRSHRGVGLRQDLRVEVVNAQAGESYVVVVEVKGIWNDDLRSNLASQLARDYLIDGGLTHGIYLVVSFDAAQVTDANKRSAILRNQVDNLLGLLEDQSTAFKPELQIRPVIHDASLPLTTNDPLRS